MGLEYYLCASCHVQKGYGLWAMAQRDFGVDVLTGDLERGTQVGIILGGLKNIFEGLLSTEEITNDSVVIYTSSDYLVKMFNDNYISDWEINGWKSTSGDLLKNKELIKEVVDLYHRLEDRKVNITFVKDNTSVMMKSLLKRAGKVRKGLMA